MAVTIGEASRHNLNQQQLLQHARVATQRIESSIGASHATSQFPGAVVFTTVAGSVELPDTLVVWRPEPGSAALGELPRFSELLIYCPGIYQPEKLFELRATGDNRTVPPVTDVALWRAELDALKSSAAEQVELTPHLRTAVISGSGTHGVVRFVRQIRPDDAEWSQYQAGNTSWQDLSWPLDNAGGSYGVRQVWCRIEMQLTTQPGGADPGGRTTIPFFGSATVNYGMTP